MFTIFGKSSFSDVWRSAAEAATEMFFYKVFLEILQNSQENTCVTVSETLFSCEFCEISKISDFLWCWIRLSITFEVYFHFILCFKIVTFNKEV